MRPHLAVVAHFRNSGFVKSESASFEYTRKSGCENSNPNRPFICQVLNERCRALGADIACKLKLGRQRSLGLLHFLAITFRFAYYSPSGFIGKHNALRSESKNELLP